MTIELETPQKIHIETWGCQMNVADSERMLALMKNQNYTLTDKPDDADLIVLNTCHIREKARHKMMSRLGVLKSFRKTNPNLTIAVAGCVAQAEGKKLLELAPTIDVLLGPGRISELPKLVQEHKSTNRQAIAVGFPQSEPKLADPLLCQDQIIDVPQTLTGRNEISRFVNIQQGCNNFCTFCVVPFTRGKELSLHPQQIISQAKAFVEAGAKEITLLGQNVNSYGLDLVAANLLPATGEGPFVDLLKEAAKIPGLKSLRFTTSNPHDFTKPIAELFPQYPVMGKYIHLPVQSGSNHILERMKRKVTREEYLQRIVWVREAVPGMSISTDLIVGFPGETEEHFEETLDLMRTVQFRFVYAFTYSPRKNTAAMRFKDQVPEDVKTARLARLNQLQDAMTLEYNQQEIGTEQEVLIHYGSKKDPGFYFGRTAHLALVRVQSARPIDGQSVMVKIVSGNKNALSGELI